MCRCDSPDPENLRLLARVFNRLAYHHADANRHVLSEECWVRQVALLEEVVKRGDAKFDDRRNRADGLLNIAHARGRDGRREAAHEAYAKAVESFRVLAADHPGGWFINAHNALTNLAETGPGRGSMLSDLAASQRRVGHEYRDRKEYTDAMNWYRAAQKTAQEWLAKERESVEAANELAKCHYDMAIVCERLSEPEETVRHLECARTLRLPLVEREPKRCDLHHDLGLTLTFLGSKVVEVGRADDALPLLRDGAEQYRLELTGQPKPAGRLSLASNLLRQSEVTRKTGQLAAAEMALAERRGLLQDQPQELYATAQEFAALALFATGGKTRPSDDDEAARRRYSGFAVETLKQAFAAGYKDVEGARKDAAFAPLRRLPEFNALVMKP